MFTKLGWIDSVPKHSPFILISFACLLFAHLVWVSKTLLKYLKWTSQLKRRRCYNQNGNEDFTEVTDV